MSHGDHCCASCKAGGACETSCPDYPGLRRGPLASHAAPVADSVAVFDGKPWTFDLNERGAPFVGAAIEALRFPSPVRGWRPVLQNLSVWHGVPGIAAVPAFVRFGWAPVQGALTLAADPEQETIFAGSLADAVFSFPGGDAGAGLRPPPEGQSGDFLRFFMQAGSSAAPLTARFRARVRVQWVRSLACFPPGAERLGVGFDST